MADAIELRTPRQIEDLGISPALVQDLTLRRALFEGRTSSLKLAAGIGVGPQVMATIVEELRELRYLEVLGLDGRDYQLTLTDGGKEQANDRLRLCRYAGFAPVSLTAYTAVISAQQAEPEVTHETMGRAFADLVVNDRLLDELGPALLSDGALFLYGPPGTGKSSLAERLSRVHHDAVLVPRAVEIDNQIITVFDPVVHVPLPEQPAELDPRWVLCRRPAIVAGGELQLSQLDLTFEASNGVYLAPLQMQANNGVFVIDDFGRQLGLTPESLLNRWIVPLDRRVDYLSLSYGLKFEIPFDVKVVFSTNREPSSLGDEAFFRRIQNKILVPPISDEDFDEVLYRVTTQLGVAIEDDAPAYLRWVSRELGDGDLRPYLPKEFCKILRSVCKYNRLPVVLNRANIDRVASVYFTRDASLTGSDGAARLPSTPPPPPTTPPSVTPAPVPAAPAVRPADTPLATRPARENDATGGHRPEPAARPSSPSPAPAAAPTRATTTPPPAGDFSFERPRT